MEKKHVVVIGGGLGGLSASISLAAAGHQVTILEKNERIGGKCNIRSGEGYHFDTGPSILTMPWVLEELFKRAGRDVHEYMTIERVEPQWRTFFEDGVTIDLKGDLPDMLNEIKRVSPQDAAPFLTYLSYSSQMYELCRKSFYNKSISGLNELRKLHTLRELMALDPMKSVNVGTEKFISDPHLRQILNFLVMYVGSSPYQAPAVLSQLGFVQFGLGNYYVKGGMYNIVLAMEKLLAELNVVIRTETEVTSIIQVDSVAKGVRLATGEEFHADLVVSNLEAIPTYQSLLKEHTHHKTQAKKLEKFEPSVSGLVLMLGIKRQYPQLTHHNFFFSNDPEVEFKQIFEEKRPADDPTIYIGISSKSDPEQAPEGKENHFILTHVPPLQEGENWSKYEKSYRETVLGKLERNGLENIRNEIEFEYTFTPDDIRSLYGSNGGSIYGVVADKKKNGGFKIPSRSNLIANLYFVGGSTHPGGGVPMVTLSGQLTADLIAEDMARSEKHIG
ncbi:phytoene desaturase family protein [Shouchella patagoniensis]|uniref:phytoene desaturase family protein n=1 Tax=Shouchella patagoniensis TaxID=228576 RepID=UPI00099564B1|nr:phytoene desaturase family protein [Shouchella patagoniensis]